MILVYYINFHTQQTPKGQFPLAKICVVRVVFGCNCTLFFFCLFNCCLLDQVTLHL